MRPPAGPDDAPGPDPSGDVPSRSGAGRFVKPLVSLTLYVLIFWFTDVSAIFGRLAAARLEYVAAGVALYAFGQALSAWRWRLLLEPVNLRVRYPRMVSFYFIGMFFNLFLPTIVGGDAVKALLLARETGKPARSAISVFMERDLGLLALLLIAVGAGWWAPPVTIVGLRLSVLTLLLLAAFIAVNVVLMHPAVYAAADRLIQATPLRVVRARAGSLYEAMAPYWSAHGTLVIAFLLSVVFQAVVIGVVFLNARALHSDLSLSAVALFVPLISLGGMLPVSVNGLGVREALYVLLFGRVGVPTEISVSLALLYLAVTFVASLPGGVLYALQDAPLRLPLAGRAAGHPR